MKAAVDLLVERLNGLMPRHGIVLGSGLGSLVNEVRDAVRIPYSDLPGFPLSGVSGHAGEIVAGYLGRTPSSCWPGACITTNTAMPTPCASRSKC